MKFWKKLAERAAKTFVQVFLVVFLAGIANVDVLNNVSAIQTVAVSAAAAGLSAVSSLVSKKFGPDTDSPSIV